MLPPTFALAAAAQGETSRAPDVVGCRAAAAPEMVSEEGTGWATRKRLVLAALALIASLLLADLAANLLLLRDGTFRGRPLPPYGTLLTAAQREQLRERRAAIARGRTSAFDAELGWVNRPSLRGADGEGFNSIGARGPREYAPRPPAGVLRFVSFGDSFTHCAQVGWRDSWQAQIEEREPAWEVINLGVNGYGTDQALLRFRRTGAALGAQVVLIGLMLENVARNVNRYKPLLSFAIGSLDAKPRFLLRGDRLELLPLPFSGEAEMLDLIEAGRIGALLSEHEHWSHPALPRLAWRSAFVRLGVAWWESGARGWRGLWLDAQGEPRRLTIALLETFHREALAAGALAAPVLIWPSEQDLRGWLERGDRYWTVLLEELDLRGVPCLDLAQALAREGGGDVAQLYNGVHLSRAGNGLVARAVSEWVEEQGIEAR